MTTTTVFAPIVKSVEQDDGSILVYGKATDGSLDGDMQRCDPAWLATAMPAWYLTGGNIREQHDAHRAIGKAVDHEADGNGGHWITARIVDPVAVLKTKAEVFTGFSIGIQRPKIDKSHPDAPGGVINGGEVVEVSLCDRPSNPNCVITLAKAATPGMEVAPADLDQERMLVRCEELHEGDEAKTVGDTTTTDDTADETDEAADSATKALGATAADGLTVSIADNLSPEAIARLADLVAEKVIKGAPKGDADKAATDTTTPADTPADTPVTTVTVPDPETPAADKAAGPDGVAAPVGETPGTPGVAEGQDAPGEIAPDPAPEAMKAPGVDIEKATGVAKALVGAIIAKVDGDDMAGYSVPDDETLATVAISIIARLIQSEAGDMVVNPGEDDDIHCLLSAVASLRWFVRRERAEGGAGGGSSAAPIYWSATPDSPQVAVPAEVAAAPAEKAAPAGTATVVIPANTPEVTTTNSTNAAVTKAATVTDSGSAADPDAIVKALEAALGKADSPFRAVLEGMITSSTEATVKSVSDLTERLAKVEAMPIPGGPARQATAVQQVTARRSDLTAELRKFQTMADKATDNDLRRGYAAKAASIEAELHTL